MNKKALSIPIILFALLFFATSMFFTVNEIQYAIVFQFGKSQKIITEPGLYFKIPLIQNVNYFDSRILEYDAAPKPIVTQDKKTLIVDNFARWKIDNPLQFFKSVRNTGIAVSRIDDIIYSILREELGKHDLIEIVNYNRSEIMATVTEKSAIQLKEYGIDVKDVRIKRADLPEENEKAVFDRMRAERNRKAKQYRSEGEEEALKIRALTDKERKIILAEAYKKAEILRGEGDGDAINIYAKSYEKSPSFYEFVRTLEAYETTFDKGETDVVLSSDSDFLKFMKKGPQ
ncbi:MAG: protease modulator HflC [Calditrichaeota bacterium]|nr:MAG: protease modulator HflC [Calditrichota bacterium]